MLGAFSLPGIFMGMPNGPRSTRRVLVTLNGSTCANNSRQGRKPPLWSMPTEEAQRLALAEMLVQLGPVRPRAMRVFHLTLMYDDRTHIEQSFRIGRPLLFEQQRARLRTDVQGWLQRLGLGSAHLDWAQISEVHDGRV